MRTVLLFLICFNLTNTLFAQIKVLRFNQSESIIINHIDKNKIPIFVFVNNESIDEETDNVLSILNSTNIDFEHFEIVLIKITPAAICSPDKKLILGGYDSLPSSFVLDPHYILIKDNGSLFNELITKRFKSKTKDIIQLPTKNNQVSGFYKISSHKVLNNIISFNYSEKGIVQRMDSLENELDQLRRGIKYLRSDQNKNEGSSIKVAIGFGSFLQWYKISSNQAVKPRQGWTTPPFARSYVFEYRYKFADKISLIGGLDILVLETDIYTKNIDKLKIPDKFNQNKPFAISSTNPIARTITSNFFITAGIDFTALTLKKDLFLHAAGGLGIGKALSNSKADFLVQLDDKSVIGVVNSDIYYNKFSTLIFFNPYIEQAINKSITLNFGLMVFLCQNRMTSTADNYIIDDDLRYKALEKFSEKIISQGIEISIGLGYNINSK